MLAFWEREIQQQTANCALTYVLPLLESCVVGSRVSECEVCDFVDQCDVDFVARFLHFHIQVRSLIWISLRFDVSTLFTVMLVVAVFACSQ
jgi:hypothetical protein